MSPEENKLLVSSVIIKVGTNPWEAIYTKHKLVVNGYQTGTDIIVEATQATAKERHGYGCDYSGQNQDFKHSAIMKITTTGETNGSDELTMEYKDRTYCNFCDIPSGCREEDMRIHYLDNSSGKWKMVPGIQTVDTGNNTVTATIVNLMDSQLYAVQPYSVGIENWEQYYK